MTTVDKQLARFAKECRRVDADRWQLALSNGYELALSARRADGFLLLDAETGEIPVPDRLLSLAERASELPASVKFALCRGSSALRLRAEFPLPEEGGVAGRICQNLGGMLAALHRLRDPVSYEAAAEGTVGPDSEDDPGPAVPGSLTDSLTQAGWDYRERPGGALLADLEAGDRFFQAEIDSYGAGARFRVTLCRNDDAQTPAQQALSVYLLEANAMLRFARGFLEPGSEGVAAGFEVRMESGPTPAEAGHALAALSVASRHCARELEILKDGALAGIYLSARPPFHHSAKGA
jgi:hypothetical protein